TGGSGPVVLRRVAGQGGEPPASARATGRGAREAARLPAAVVPARGLRGGAALEVFRWHPAGSGAGHARRSGAAVLPFGGTPSSRAGAGASRPGLPRRGPAGAERPGAARHAVPRWRGAARFPRRLPHREKQSCRGPTETLAADLL